MHDQLLHGNTKMGQYDVTASTKRDITPLSTPSSNKSASITYKENTFDISPSREYKGKTHSLLKKYTSFVYEI